MTLVDVEPELTLSELPDTHIRHASGRHVHKTVVLVVVAIAQLMVVLDATIVNVALEHIATALKIRSNADLSWVVTGYALTFGGFLLLGGKLADRLGRRNIFMLGATMFAGASLLGGLADNLGTLIAARTFQGVGGALMSPAALSILTVVFKEGEERNRALGIWATITAGGAAFGLILGGVLTEYASWRWVFFVNVPIAALAVLGSLRFIPESKDERAQGFDIPGAVFITGGLMALVFALVKGNDYGWTSFKTTWWLGLAALLVVAFLQVQVVTRTPLIPTKLLALRNVVGSDVGSLFIGAGIFAIFFFMVLWMQQVNGWSPIQAGVAFLPMPFSIGISAGIASKLLGKVGPRPLLVVGPLVAATGLLSLGLRLGAHSSYLTVVLPSLVCVALGMGMTFVSLTSSAVAGVAHEDAGLASAMLNAGQQVGGALGLAILTAVSTSRTEHLFPHHTAFAQQLQVAQQTHQPVDPGLLARFTDATVSGWGVGFVVGASLIVTAAVIIRSLVHVTREDAAVALKEAMAAG
jgi:EmrB/QacA subfamily drug resistance transporter